MILEEYKKPHGLLRNITEDALRIDEESKEIITGTRFFLMELESREKVIELLVQRYRNDSKKVETCVITYRYKNGKPFFSD